MQTCMYIYIYNNIAIAPYTTASDVCQLGFLVVYTNNRFCLQLRLTPASALSRTNWRRFKSTRTGDITCWGTQNWSDLSLVGGLNPSEKYERQLGWLFPIYGKIKLMFQTTNQKSLLGGIHSNVPRFNLHQNQETKDRSQGWQTRWQFIIWGFP